MSYRQLGHSWFQQRAEGLDHVERSMDEYHVDDSNEAPMVDDVRDDPLISMRLAYPGMHANYIRVLASQLRQLVL